MDRSIRLFKIFGISIELHYTWFLIFLLLAWGLSADFFPNYYPGLGQAEYWTMGIAASVLLFISVLIHEMSHSIVSKRNKIDVKSITLFFFGGIANISGEEGLSPKKEFKMAIAGPLVSLLLAGLFFFINRYAAYVYVEAITYYLYRLNFILAAFNLAPGYPLDGGRVLRSAIWAATKDIKKATRLASLAGKAIAGLLIAAGLLGMFAGAGTLWFVILGFFLYFIAGASYDQIVLKEGLKGAKAKDVMIKEFNTISPEADIAELFEDYFLRRGADSAIVAENSSFKGIVSMSSLKNIPKKDWLDIKVKEVMTPAAKISKAKEPDKAFDLLKKMSEQKTGILPVIKNKKLSGVVTLSSLLRYSEFKSG